MKNQPFRVNFHPFCMKNDPFWLVAGPKRVVFEFWTYLLFFVRKFFIAFSYKKAIFAPMKKVLITGANGLLGQKLVFLLTQQPDIQTVA
ncbi:MAG: hypothetical protein ACOVRK_02755, partial [Chryseobacterium taeanense]